MPEDLLAFTWNGNNDGNIDLIKIKFNFTQATGRQVLFDEMSLQNYLIADLAHNDTKGFIKYIHTTLIIQDCNENCGDNNIELGSVIKCIRINKWLTLSWENKLACNL